MLISATPSHWRPVGALWDLDGTLVDTEPLWMSAERELAAELGGTWSEADAAGLIGSDLRDAGRHLQGHFGTSMPVDDIVDFLVTRVSRGLAGGTPWRPGVRELVEAFEQAGVPQALVTMSYSVIADPVAAQLPFAAVVSGDRVTYGKPHPEPYLLAAEALGVEAADCLAIEDSPTGAASANAAGCRVLAVPHVVAVPDHPNRRRAGSLAGLTPAAITALFTT
ncbi:MAG: HAD family phosphatase [Aeromicrobium sp.]|uniref:HAD family hydrolase n=1 Tax=Aeromicrobium sp. TaxID=1871063 RepID=UPI0039E2E69F